MRSSALAIALALLPAGSAFAQFLDDDDDQPPAPRAQPQPPPQRPQPQRPPAYPQYPQYPQQQYPQQQYPQYPQQPYQQPQYPQYQQPGRPYGGQYPQQPSPQGYPQYQQYPQQQYPRQQYPQYQYPPNQYPAGTYRDPSGRVYQLPPPQGQLQPGQPPPGVTPAAPTEHAPLAPPAVMTITTATDAARAATGACADALENYHLDGARAKCGEALAKDDQIALAHLYLALAASSPQVAHAELQRAVELSAKASAGERTLIAAQRAWKESRLADARQAFDQLCTIVPGEKRAFLRRGLFRQVALGDLESAIADYRRAINIDEKYAAAQNFLGFALADQGKVDEGRAALRRYAELAPGEPNAHDSLASLALRGGDALEAMAEERKALTLDPKFLVAHLTMGDALLATGKTKDARREYALLDGSDDPALRHDGAMRAARAALFEDRSLDAEKALIREAAETRKASRPGDAAAAFLEAARLQIERGALGEAGRGIREASESLKRPPVEKPAPGAPPASPPPNLIEEDERRRLSAQLVELRAMALASLGEREAAEARADELGALLKLASDPHADDRVRVLKGWIAYRVGDDKAALAQLERAAAPSMRLTYAMALQRSGDAARARPIFEELARRSGNDLETALTRPRAAAQLKTPPAATTAAAK